MIQSKLLSQRKKFILLTGATGLLGRFLMRDLLAKGLLLAVLVRPTPSRKAPERIANILSNGLPRPYLIGKGPVVIEGELDGTTRRLSIKDADSKWIKEHVATVLNSAASLEFNHSLRSDEPFRTNVEGTRALIDFSRSAGIKAFHHVSTAYICGDRRDVILETDCDCGQKARNAYEKSKLAAELLVNESKSFFETVTIHRPSIIVGDYSWGFTSTFHGFYLPLKILDALYLKLFETSDASQFWSALGMSATDCKNLVPVDWVSAIITRIVSEQCLYGRTYHITNRRPTPVNLIGDVFAEALSIGEHSLERRIKQPPLFDAFSTQMEPYRAYWGNDPIFDQSHLENAVPDLPAPKLSRQALLRLSRFALHHRFVFPE